MEEKQSRRRMRLFLEENIDTIPGLTWHDKGKKEFRISWKNKKNSTWTDTDAQIFKSYAKFVGKFEEGDEEDPTYWKGLFRSALRNSPDTEEIKELRNGKYDKENAYRVYRFLDNALASSKGRDENTSHATDLEYSSSMDSSSHSQSQASSTCPRNFLEDLLNSEMTVARRDSSEQSFDMNSLNVPEVVRVFEDVSNSSNHEAMNTDTLEEFPPDTYTARYSPHYHQRVSEITPEVDLSPDLMSIETNKLMSPSSPVSESMIIASTLPSGLDFTSDLMKIKVFFADHCILCQNFDEKGARLFCGDIASQAETVSRCGIGIYGPMDMSQIAIPYVDEMRGELPISQVQKQLIRKIQNNMNRGLLLGSDKTHIYAKRMCKARVCFMSQDGKWKLMNRSENNIVCVFDLDYFKQQLQSYSTEGSTQPLPSVTIYFGQDLTADAIIQRHVALYAKVTHLEAEKLLIQALENRHSHLEVFASKSNPDDALADLLEQRLSVLSLNNPVQK